MGLSVLTIMLLPHRNITTGPLRLKDHYVYIWYDGPTIIYIGAGCRYRAWAPHSQKADALREAASHFRIHIYSHGLPKAVAHKQERRLIALHRPKGNTRCPSTT